jgi:hypothetical protein
LRNWLLTIALVGLVTAACADTAEPAATTAPARSADTTVAAAATTNAVTTTDAAVTTRESSSTTAVEPQTASSNMSASDVAAQFDTSGDDLVAVMTQWRDMFNAFEAEPVGTAEEIVDEMFTADYTLRDNVLADFGELVDNDWRFTDGGSELVGVRIRSFDGDNAVVWEATVRGANTDWLQVISDSDGNEVKTYPGWELRVRELHLRRRDADSRWLVHDAPSQDSTFSRQELTIFSFDWIREDYQLGRE